MMKARKHKTRQDKLPKSENKRLPFAQHLFELRRRLFYVVLSIGLWATGAYFVQQHIVTALLKPAHNQQFIYTSVGGGIDFLFRVCLYAGIVCSIPVIVYQILKYLEPLIKKDAVRFIALGSVASGVLAIAGMFFGYAIGLPSALHFLLHQFTTDQIHPLLTIQSYMSFVTLYMLGSALLFQLPLLLVLINRIKPLQPKKLLGYERWVILIAFVLGGIMNPSPRVQDQVLLAGPMIISYQLGLFLVWFSNRGTRRPRRVLDMRIKDSEAQAARRARFEAAQAVLHDHRVATRPLAAVSPVPHKRTPMPQRAGTAPQSQTQTIVTPATLAPVPQHVPPRGVPTRSHVAPRGQRRAYVDFAPRRNYQSLERSPDAPAPA
ncbi:MAG TPA: twin-arginine translocase subunit TatC [Bacillota bacterium]|nr:twin-arginine translocase subunit TatC [Bacillota bacterium]